MKYRISILETLKRDVIINCENEEQAKEQVENEYKHGKHILDESDLFRVDFSLNGLSQNENEILNEIHNFCRECAECENCIEEECLLFRIEKIILGKEK